MSVCVLFWTVLGLARGSDSLVDICLTRLFRLLYGGDEEKEKERIAGDP